MRFPAVPAAQALIALGLLLSPAVAYATDTQACLAASEKGQRSRASGKLRDAQKQFAVCSDSTCPGLVRRDCGQWQSEISGLIPSVVFGAKDRSGHDVFDVMVTMDGEPLLRSLDGKSVPVDPGPHLFLFETGGQPGVTERVLVKEGEKARSVNVVLGPDTSTPKPPSGVAEPTPPKPTPPDTSGEAHHTAAPWVVVGVGGATLITGIILVAARPSLPSNCNGDSHTCTRRPGETNADYSGEQNQAGDHDSRLQLGLVVGAVGLGVIAGGLVWHFLEPSGPKTGAVRVSPWTTANGGGLTVLGAF